MKKVVLIERYMKKTWITTACLLFATVAIGQVPELSPTPQSCVLGKDKYQKPSIFLFKGLNETDTVNQRFAENLLPKQKEQGKYWKLIVGEAGDRSVLFGNGFRNKVKDIICGSETMRLLLPAETSVEHFTDFRR